MLGTRSDKYPIEWLSTFRKFWMPNLMEEINTVVLVEFRFEQQEKLKLKAFLRTFWTITVLMQWRKRTFLKFNFRLQVTCFVLSFYWRKMNLNWSRTKCLKVNPYQNIWRFWKFRLSQLSCMVENEKIVIWNVLQI